MRRLSNQPRAAGTQVNKAQTGNQNSHRADVQHSSDIKHESAVRHVTGAARYVDDIPILPGQLHVAVGLATEARATIRTLNLDQVRSAPGVVDLIVQDDIPGNPDIAPVFNGDPLLSGGDIKYRGQPIFAVAATSFRAAQQAIARAKIQYSPETPQLHPRDALEQNRLLLPVHRFRKGDPEALFSDRSLSDPDIYVVENEIDIAGQEHFYLEGQIAQAVPTEEGGIFVQSSSQHPTEVQKLVAEVLDLPIHQVQTEVRRMGGGFGGKESQAAAPACIAALFALRTGRPVRYRMPRRDDMVQTGKRHPFWNRYRAICNAEGKIKAAQFMLAGDCGHSIDLSQGIVDRAMFHADNAYALPHALVEGYACQTDKVSHTAFRGFGGPQGVLTCEAMLDDIARATGLDPLDVRKHNLYQPGDQTPYGQTIEESVLPDLIEELEQSCDYRSRRQAISNFNRQAAKQHSPVRKGIALTPVKFGISFTSKHLNQAGALLHIYTDGSIHLNHGGTEMGQGLFTKIAQIVANEFGVALDRVMVSATRTDKVPNTSPTAASAGSDLNGMAALNACTKIKARLQAFAEAHFQQHQKGSTPLELVYEQGQVKFGAQRLPFADFIKQAYMNRVSLSDTGFYSTPKIGYDRERGQGRPFLYFANGAACSEVLVDSTTGEYRVTAVDILHDVGTSLNRAIDIGQIEGAFIQGMGWLTTEELRWDDRGRQISDSPANYKIPTAFDTPERFNVQLFERPNHADNIYRSKAVGEPPLMLAISVWCALRDACASFCNYAFNPRLDPPATPERVYWAIRQACQAEKDKHVQSNRGENRL